MSNGRVYAAGRGSDLNAFVEWIDPVTHVITAMPAIGVVGQLRSIAVIAEDDIWVGWYYQSSQSNYPRVAHWDGASWTVMEMTHLPPIYQQYSVVDFCVVSSNEIYAIVSPDKVVKWNGSSWSTHISTSGLGLAYSISEFSSILPESTGSDMWLGMLGSGINYVGHWNGSIFDEHTRLVANDTGDDTSGLITYKGEIYAACRDATAKARTGVDTWATRFTVPYSFSPIFGGRTWWRDDTENILWCGSQRLDGVQRGGVTKWDGVTATRYENTLSSTAYVQSLAGISNPGQDAKLFYVTGSGATFRIRESNGTWVNVTAPGGTYYVVHALPADLAPPYLANLSPYAGEVGVLPDGSIQLDILDDGTGVNDASVVIKVNSVTAWTGDAQQAGFTVVKSVVALGFRYVITPDSFLPSGTTTVEVYAEDLA